MSRSFQPTRSNSARKAAGHSHHLEREPAPSDLPRSTGVFDVRRHVSQGAIRDILLEVFTQFGLYLQEPLGDYMSAQQYSRRKAVSSLAATVACALAGPIPVTAEPVSAGETQDCAGPIFSTTGPNAELYGAKDGYPLPGITEARRQGDPWEPKYRVGAFTHIDHIYPTRLIKRAVALGSSSARGQKFTTIFREASFRPSTTCRAIRSLAC